MHNYFNDKISSQILVRNLIKRKISAYNHDLEKLSLNDIKKILIINSPPRSGSSMVFACLSNNQMFYSLCGETTPYYRMHFQHTINSEYDSDATFYKRACNMDMLAEDLIYSFYTQADPNLVFNNYGFRSDYLLNIMYRLTLQWPTINFVFEDLLALLKQVFNKYATNTNSFDNVAFYIVLLTELMKNYPEINPYYYDIDPQIIKKNFPDLILPSAPPYSESMCEEPPFVLSSPKRHVTRDDMAHKHLLLKTSIDVYNMKFLFKLFPNAKIKVLILLRNPAGSINGLYDGWLHRGFFSYNLESFFREKPNYSALNIAGYSDYYCFGGKWWKFDLPPSWNKYINKNLFEVCAFQYYSSIQAINNNITNLFGDIQYIIIFYENLIKGHLTRQLEFNALNKALNFDKITPIACCNLPIVQATTPPEIYRWHKRKDIIMTVLSKEIMDSVKHFGYTLEGINEWL